jgi:cation diffusion facilitator family transporter
MGGYFIQRFLNRRIVDQDHREDRSLTMMADHAHYSGDVAMNLAGVIALVAIWYTGLTILDPILAIFGALFLIKAAYPTLKQCYFDIVHVRIDPNMQQEIVDIIFASDIRVQGIHQLRSRELGPNLFIDFHMVLDRNITLEEAHDISDQVEESIKRKFTRADIVIHLDPDSEFDHEFWEPQYSTDKFHSRSKSTTPI